MSGYRIEDVPSIDLDDGQVEILSTHDEQQAALMAEALIRVDERDNVIGPVSKIDAHQGSGIFHRAFSILLFNSEGKLLLQQRSGDKVTFPNVWANSCCSHPLHSDDELEDTDHIGTKKAAIRKLEQELGIDPTSINIDDFVFMTKMRYSARMNPEWIERELDHILMLTADVQLNPNPNEIAAVRLVGYD